MQQVVAAENSQVVAVEQLVKSSGDIGCPRSLIGLSQIRQGEIELKHIDGTV
jgi:hypothetical protein